MELQRVGQDLERKQSTNINIYIRLFMCFPVVKNLLANAGDAGDKGSIPGSGRSPGGGQWQPTPVFLSGKSHGQGSLVGYIPWGHKESNVTAKSLT